jgi:uncharacterized membrane protein
VASKSKRARQAAAKAKTKSAWPVIAWALVAALAGYLQNRYGQFSDIRGFYGMRFQGGSHQWPYDWYTPVGAASPLHPIEYPVISGLIVWLLTFITPQTGNPIFNYFSINALINAALFVLTAFYVRKLSDNKHTYLYIFGPAVVLALNLNWDLWAMVPTLAAIYFFEKRKYTKSAVLLGIGIATKFFPVVLLLPIAIFMYKDKNIKEFTKYFSVTAVTWFSINLPVAILSFEGWKYFYTFSFHRILGEGSIYSIFYKFKLFSSIPNSTYLILNIMIFATLAIMLFKSKRNTSLSTSAYFTIFAFTIFGKQYSMQYILWLAPLAVIAISQISKRNKLSLTYLYILWQALEIGFRYSYFQNMVTNVYKAKGEMIMNAVSDTQYAVISSLRYGSIILFTIFLALSSRNTKTEQNQ